MGPEPPLISVCVPVYNRAELVRETLDSVLAQDYPNVEILVQDDASVDGTPDVLAAYAARCPQIRVERNERNLGISRTFNRVVDRTRGEFVLKLDSDDMIAPDYLTTCAEALQGERIDVVTTGHVWLENGRRTPAMPKVPKGLLRGGLRTMLAQRPYQSTFLARRAFLDRMRLHGRVYREGVATSDFDLWLRIAARGGQVLFLSDYRGLIVRRHPGNNSRRNRASYRNTALTILANRADFLAQCPLIYRYKLSRILYRDWRDWWRGRPVDWRLHRAVRLGMCYRRSAASKRRSGALRKG